MKALQVACIMGAIAFTGIYLAAGNRPAATGPDPMPEAAVSAVAPGAPALSAAVPEASAASATALAEEPGSVTAAASGPLMARAEISDYSIGITLAAVSHQDVAVPATRDVPDNASRSEDAPKSAPVTQDFRYLIYYVWSELPPAGKPADVVLSAFKDIPVGTPVEEIKRASDAFGLDFHFMKAVAKIEFQFQPQSTHGFVYRPVPAERIRVRQIRLRANSQSPRQCRCGRLQGHYRRHPVRVDHAQEAGP